MNTHEKDRESQGIELELQQCKRELEDTRQKLIHQEKMASIGEMTAGIAHEIKNPLNFVNNFSKLSIELIDDIMEDLNSGEALEDKLDDIKADLEDLKENIARIDEHGCRADSIVSSMLMHSRGGSSEKTDIDINQLLSEYVDLAFHGMKAKDRSFFSDISKEFDDKVQPVNVVAQDISRVILNIVTNGFQALRDHYKMPKPGDKPCLSVKTEHRGDGATIRISDNGTGIPEEVKARIFEPFFTTKPSGEGTGLGLSMSRDIIENHGGHLDINTAEGKGSEFQIFIPYSKS